VLIFVLVLLVLLVSPLAVFVLFFSLVYFEVLVFALAYFFPPLPPLYWAFEGECLSINI
jgi:hypothetical protein